MSSCRHHLMLIGTRLAVQMIFEFAAELLHYGERRHGRGVAQWAERTTEHIPRNIADQINVAARPTACVEALQNFFQPCGAFTARDAPAAAFVRVEAHDT